MSSKNLQDFVFISKYAKVKESGDKESYEEAVKRVMNMHYNFMDIVAPTVKHDYIIVQAEKRYLTGEILGAQRSLQFGGPPLLKHMMRGYNCSSSYLDRVDFFKEIFYILLCGAGAGYSVQNVHINCLPVVQGQADKKVKYVVEDAIEGWADSTDALIRSHFFNLPIPEFDYSLIRKKGALISGGFKAPGPEPLEAAHKKIHKILLGIKSRKMTSFEGHYLTTIIANAVISGGIRRSALIVLFDAWDKEMATCKSGNWFIDKPELARSNNSAVILPDTPEETFRELFESTKQYGEPGFAYLKSAYHAYNPCFEVGMIPTLEIGNPEKTGWSLCNLTEINGSKVNTAEDLYDFAEAASALGTIQASYTSFPYLGDVTEQIVRRDALIGVGITGMASNPKILFDPEVQRIAARKVVKTNKRLSALLGINAAARTTVVKPSGNSSQMLGTSSGIHPYHSRKYIRNVQVNEEEQAGKVVEATNPKSVTSSVYNSTDKILSFPITVNSKAYIKEDLSAIDFLELVRITQNNWVKEGTNLDHITYRNRMAEGLTHNVSNTVTVKPGEWEEVMYFLYANKNDFTGVSLLSSSGDLDYPQAPFMEVWDEDRLAKEYGSAAILASGLIVDGLSAFENNLFAATDTALTNIDGVPRMNTQNLVMTKEDVMSEISKGLSSDGSSFEMKVNGLSLHTVKDISQYLASRFSEKLEWIRRFEGFAKKYVEGDFIKTAECLKRISAFHQFKTISNGKEIKWNQVTWDSDNIDADSISAEGCYGGQCAI